MLPRGASPDGRRCLSAGWPVERAAWRAATRKERGGGIAGARGSGADAGNKSWARSVPRQWWRPVIGRIGGQLVEVSEQTVLVDVAGVGYEVDVPTQTLTALPRAGGEIVLHTHFIVRDDAQQLYGFDTRGERDLFRALLRITGVGPRLALSVISSIDIGDLALAAAEGDVSRLVKVKGVGRRTAERMLLELKDRLAGLDIAAPGRLRAAAAGPLAEAERALVALGYKPAEAARAIAAVDGDGLATEQLVHAALKAFAGPERIS